MIQFYRHSRRKTAAVNDQGGSQPVSEYRARTRPPGEVGECTAPIIGYCVIRLEGKWRVVLRRAEATETIGPPYGTEQQAELAARQLAEAKPAATEVAA